MSIFDETLRYLGWRGQEINSQIEGNIRRAIDECRAAAQPRHVSLAFDLEAAPDGIRLIGTPIVLTGASIARHLANARKIEVAAFTLGVAVDRELTRLSHTEPSRAVLLDAAATALIEEYCDNVEADIRKIREAEGLSLLPRFSPGYGDLPIELQSPLLSLLDAGRKIGLTATAASVLIPRKSVTAVMGICDDDIADCSRPCDNCSKRGDCNYCLQQNSK